MSRFSWQEKWVIIMLPFAFPAIIFIMDHTFRWWVFALMLATLFCGTMSVAAGIWDIKHRK